MNLWKIKMIDDDGLILSIIINKPNLEECLVFAKNFSKKHSYMLREIEQIFSKTDHPGKPYRRNIRN
mgnify:CR=1 FL=1